MNKSLSPAAIWATLGVVVVAAALFLVFGTNRMAPRLKPMPSGPIPIPKSQIGTRLGNRIIGASPQLPGGGK